MEGARHLAAVEGSEPLAGGVVAPSRPGFCRLCPLCPTGRVRVESLCQTGQAATVSVDSHSGLHVRAMSGQQNQVDAMIIRKSLKNLARPKRFEFLTPVPSGTSGWPSYRLIRRAGSLGATT